MTVTMAYIDHNTAYMAVDSSSSSENELVISKGVPKMWKITVPQDSTKKVQMLVGFTGSFAVGQFVHHAFVWPLKERNQTWLQYFVQSVITVLQNSIRRRFQHQQDIEWEFLVCMPGHIFRLTQCGTVEQPIWPFHAVGDGAQVALGALHALHHEGHLYPDECLQRAFDASQIMRTTVRGPLHIFTVCS